MLSSGSGSWIRTNDLWDMNPTGTAGLPYSAVKKSDCELTYKRF